MGSNHTMLTSAQAAEYLGTSRQVVYWYVRSGRLKRAGKQMGANGRVQHLYAEEDVQMLVRRNQEKQTRKGAVEEAVMRARRAEAMCRDLERRMSDLYELLGLQYEAPDLTEDGLRAQHRNARDMADPDGPPITTEEAANLAKSVYRMNEEQMRLLEATLSDPEPWGVYMEALNRSLEELGRRNDAASVATIRYLRIAAAHLRQVAFEFVRTAYGHVQAERIAEDSADDIDEKLASILMSDAIMGGFTQ